MQSRAKSLVDSTGDRVISVRDTGGDIHDTETSVSWFRPGMGFPDEYCGEFKSVIACPDHQDQRQTILSHCHRSQCPICFGSWAHRQATKVVNRFMGSYLEYRDNIDSGVGLPYHLTISPPGDLGEELLLTLDGYRILKRLAIRHLVSAGLIGGTVVFHPWRNTRKDKKGEWYLSPHFHVVGFGFLEQSNRFYHRTGWIYKKLKKLRSEKMVYGVTVYELSHCGIGYYQDQGPGILEDQEDEGPGPGSPGSCVHRFQALTWFGALANSKVKVVQVFREERSLPCPECGRLMHEYIPNPLRIRPEDQRLPDPPAGPAWDELDDQGLYTFGVTIKRYKLRGYETGSKDPPAGPVRADFVKDHMAERIREMSEPEKMERHLAGLVCPLPWYERVYDERERRERGI